MNFFKWWCDFWTGVIISNRNFVISLTVIWDKSESFGIDNCFSKLLICFLMCKIVALAFLQSVEVISLNETKVCYKKPGKRTQFNFTNNSQQSKNWPADGTKAFCKGLLLWVNKKCVCVMKGKGNREERSISCALNLHCCEWSVLC